MIYETKVDKLTLKDTKDNYQSYVYIAPEALHKNSGLGQLFIIAEIRSKEKKVPEMLNQIIDELSEYYYHSPTKNTEAALETTCQYFNENILDITQKKLPWVRDKISILIAAIQNNKLTLSSYQHIKVWLLRDGKIHEVASGEAVKKTNSKKFLNQLISGQLENGDVLLMTNSTIFNYFSNEKIKRTVSTLAPTQACAFFKNTLLDYKVPVDFSTIIVRFSAFKKEIREKHVIAREQALSADKDNRLLEQAEPGTIVKFGKKTTAGAKKLTISAAKVIKKTTSEVLKVKDRGKKKKTSEEGEKKSKKGQDKETKQMNGLKSLGAGKIKSAEHRLIIAIVVIAVVFAGSLMLMGNKKEEQDLTVKFEETAATLSDKIDSIEAALIYKDESRAQELLREARNLLGELKYKGEEQEYTYTQLKERIDKQSDKIFKLERPKNLVEIALLPNGEQVTSNAYIIGSEVYMASQERIYKVDIEKNTITRVAEVNKPIQKILPLDKGLILLYTGGNNALIMDTNNSTTREVSLVVSDEGSKIVDVATYGKRIYALDVGLNSIYKYNYTNGSFSPASKWLQQKVDISGNKSIAVDGSIWVAAAENNVSKFFKGKKEVFSMNGLFEKISLNTSLYTTEALNNLYLLDKEKNRITVASKQGKILRQVLGDGIDNIRAVAPGQKEKTLYIVTERGLYKF